MMRDHSCFFKRCECKLCAPVKEYFHTYWSEKDITLRLTGSWFRRVKYPKNKQRQRASYRLNSYKLTVSQNTAAKIHTLQKFCEEVSLCVNSDKSLIEKRIYVSDLARFCLETKEIPPSLYHFFLIPWSGSTVWLEHLSSDEFVADGFPSLTYVKLCAEEVVKDCKEAALELKGANRYRIVGDLYEEWKPW